MSSLRKELLRISRRALAALVKEDARVATLQQIHPDIGQIHLAHEREAHVQHLIFEGLRGAGYFTMAESTYHKAARHSRRIDLCVWMPSVEHWLYLEIKPCSPYNGFLPVVADGQKLRSDATEFSDPRDRLQGVLAYGFRNHVSRDGFQMKYERIGEALRHVGFEQVAIIRKSLQCSQYNYVQVGMWVSQASSVEAE